MTLETWRVNNRDNICSMTKHYNIEMELSSIDQSTEQYFPLLPSCRKNMENQLFQYWSPKSTMIVTLVGIYIYTYSSMSLYNITNCAALYHYTGRWLYSPVGLAVFFLLQSCYHLHWTLHIFKRNMIHQDLVLILCLMFLCVSLCAC